jgi:hypothetical protein
LLHHPEHIELTPAGHDLAICDAVDTDRGTDNLFARRRYAIELALVSAAPGQQGRHQIALGYYTIHRHMTVGEGAAPGADQPDQPVRAHLYRLASRPVHLHLGRDYLVSNGILAAIPGLVEPPVEETFVIFFLGHGFYSSRV